MSRLETLEIKEYMFLQIGDTEFYFAIGRILGKKTFQKKLCEGNGENTRERNKLICGKIFVMIYVNNHGPVLDV